MATAYLNNGATSFASTNWSDGTGFAANAELVVPSGSASVTSDVDYNATAIRYLKISEAFAGSIGTAASPLYVDATDGTNGEWSTNAPNEGRIDHGGAGTLYVKGSTAGIANLMLSGRGTMNLVSGTATYLRVHGGVFAAEDAAVVTNVFITDGSATFGAKTSGPTTLVMRGNASVKLLRPATTITLISGTLLLNATNAASANITINQYGGNVVLIAASTAGTFNYNRYGGNLDATRGSRDITIATMYTARGATFSGLPTSGANLTITNQYLLDPNAQRI